MRYGVLIYVMTNLFSYICFESCTFIHKNFTVIDFRAGGCSPSRILYDTYAKSKNVHTIFSFLSPRPPARDHKSSSDAVNSRTSNPVLGGDQFLEFFVVVVVVVISSIFGSLPTAPSCKRRQLYTTQGTNVFLYFLFNIAGLLFSSSSSSPGAGHARN